MDRDTFNLVRNYYKANCFRNCVKHHYVKNNKNYHKKWIGDLIMNNCQTIGKNPKAYDLYKKYKNKYKSLKGRKGSVFTLARNPNPNFDKEVLNIYNEGTMMIDKKNESDEKRMERHIIWILRNSYISESRIHILKYFVKFFGWTIEDLQYMEFITSKIFKYNGNQEYEGGIYTYNKQTSEDKYNDEYPALDDEDDNIITESIPYERHYQWSIKHDVIPTYLDTLTGLMPSIIYKIYRAGGIGTKTIDFEVSLYHSLREIHNLQWHIRDYNLLKLIDNPQFIEILKKESKLGEYEGGIFPKEFKNQFSINPILFKIIKTIPKLFILRYTHSNHIPAWTDTNPHIFRTYTI